MGYRSELGLCLTREVRPKIEHALSELENQNSKTAGIVQELLECGEKREDAKNGCVAYHWANLKWYADYEDVAFVENLLGDLEEEQYLFIRVGEADDDTEYRGCFWDNPFGMALIRGIAFDD
jgi:hypothetical protein